MTKMNWGPRFNNNSIARAGARYDSTVHKGMVPVQFLGISEEKKQWNGFRVAAHNSAKKAECYLAPQPPPDERMAAELRMVERVNQCIDILSFSIAEIMSTPASSVAHYKPLISVKTMIEWINHLCKMIGREIPEYTLTRAPGITQVRRCINCGTELLFTEKGPRCLACSDDQVAHKQMIMQEAHEARMAEKRRRFEVKRAQIELAKQVRAIKAAHRAKMEEAKAKRREAWLARMERAKQRKAFKLAEKEKRLERHSGHKGQDAMALGAGGPEQNGSVGGAAAHRDRAGDPGNPQGRNDGLTSKPVQHTTGADQAATPGED